MHSLFLIDLVAFNYLINLIYYYECVVNKYLINKLILKQIFSKI